MKTVIHFLTFGTEFQVPPTTAAKDNDKDFGRPQESHTYFMIDLNGDSKMENDFILECRMSICFVIIIQSVKSS